MGFATHLGPWLLGTIKNTTGTTAGTIRNLGSTIVCQEKSILYTDAASSLAFVIPAGALITNIQLQTTVAFTGTSPTLTITVGGVTVVSAVTPPSSIGVSNPTIASTLAAVNACANVGTTDALVTYTFGGTVTAGAANLVISYSVQGVDGSAYPNVNAN